MKIYVNVRMKTEFIYDLLLFHTYSKLSGFLVNLLGLMVIMAGGFLLKRGEIQLFQTWKFTVHILLKPSLKDFEHYFASM